MSSDEEFETPQYRIGVLKSPQRARQLQPRKLAFEIPPRTDSFTFLEADLRMPARSLSTGILTLKAAVEDMNKICEEQARVEADPLKLAEICERASEYGAELGDGAKRALIETVERLCEGKNQVIEDVLDKHDFIALSSLLQVHKNRKALIVFPSNKLLQWARGFLVNSTLMCPDGREKQQEALMALSQGAKTMKLKYGHRGGNQPAKETDTGRIYVTSQNRSKPRCVLLCNDFFYKMTFSRHPERRVRGECCCLKNSLELWNSKNLVFQDWMESPKDGRKGKGKKAKVDKQFPLEKILPLVPVNIEYFVGLRELAKIKNKGDVSSYKQARLFLDV